MYYMLVQCMAGPLDTGQQLVTYLFLHIISLLLYHLVYLVLPEDSMSFHLLEKTIAQTSAWRLRGHPHNVRPKGFKCFNKPKKKLDSDKIQDSSTQSNPSYLMPAFFAAFKVGCCVEDTLRRVLRPLQRAPRFLALQDAFLGNPAVRFD